MSKERDVEFLEGAVRRCLPSAEVIWTAREGRISDADLRRRYREADLRAEAEATARRVAERDELERDIREVERILAAGRAYGRGALSEAEFAALPELLEIMRAKLAASRGGRG